jgi:hypothetical protein
MPQRTARAALLVALMILGPLKGAVADEPRTALDATLEAALGGLAGEVKDFVKDKGNAVTIVSFVPHKKSHVAIHSSAGPSLVHALARQLELREVKVERISRVTLSGTFREAEDAKGNQGIELEVSLVDRDEGKEKELSHRLVLNQVTVGHLLGIPFEHGEDSTARQRAENLKREVDKFVPPKQRHPPADKWGEKPRPALRDSLILAKEDSRFAIEVLVAPNDTRKGARHKPDDYRPLSPRNEAGLAFVGPIGQDQVYAVRLHNGADFDAAVSLTIDGLSLFVVCDREGKVPGTERVIPFRDPRTDKPLFNHLIVPKGKSVLVRGWFVSLSESDEFLVTEYAKSLAGRLKSTADVGTITACFHAAWDPKGEPPPGEKNADEHAQSADATGRGARFEQKYELVERKIGILRAAVSVRYSR